ncbi:MAG: hypothetical protein LBG16_03090 [Elusimicrobiota bacterium]|jgi:hypothetical protein|nr:hypothetical protein [Elusimicrobiota bacterium]
MKNVSLWAALALLFAASAVSAQEFYYLPVQDEKLEAELNEKLNAWVQSERSKRGEINLMDKYGKRKEFRIDMSFDRFNLIKALVDERFEVKLLCINKTKTINCPEGTKVTYKGSELDAGKFLIDSKSLENKYWSEIDKLGGRELTIKFMQQILMTEKYRISISAISPKEFRKSQTNICGRKFFDGQFC